MFMLPIQADSFQDAGQPDKRVSDFGIPRSNIKEQAGQMASVAIFDNIFQMFPHSTLKAQTMIMMGCQIVNRIFFRRTDLLDDQ